jgi:hypothetical protein
MYTAIATGVLILQLTALVPVIGALVSLIAAHIGAGALVYRAWRLERERAQAPEPVPLSI